MKFIVEHLEGELETWATLEYIHMCQVVGDTNLMFTRFPKTDSDTFSSLTQTSYHPEIRTESLSDLRHHMNWKTTCLMDMDAVNPLHPNDASRFESLVFGGILGNVPSDDRTAEIRKFNFDNRRHLGDIQMTTNTALLVSQIVLKDQIELEHIPYVDTPELQLASKEYIELPFRYVAKSYITQQDSDKHIPILPDGMINYFKTTV